MTIAVLWGQYTNWKKEIHHAGVATDRSQTGQPRLLLLGCYVCLSTLVWWFVLLQNAARLSRNQQKTTTFFTSVPFVYTHHSRVLFSDNSSPSSCRRHKVGTHHLQPIARNSADQNALAAHSSQGPPSSRLRSFAAFSCIDHGQTFSLALWIFDRHRNFELAHRAPATYPVISPT